ncbi:MAG TPA: hypothetical protein VF576_01770, partial [Rubricoccaceae bacterium]
PFPMRLLSALALALTLSSAQAQETSLVFTALPVLEIPAVPDLGGATVGRVTDDARAFLQNPAALSLAPMGQAVAGSPGTTWFGESRFGTTAAAWTGRAGRFSAGVGLAQGTLSADARTLADGTPFDPTDRYRALGGSVATVGPVRLALGATARYVTSTDAPVYDGARFTVGRLHGVTADVGALVSADVAALAGRPHVGRFSPTLDVSAGYAQTHIGGRVRYSGFTDQALPRTGALGWSARVGLDVPVAGRPFHLVQAEGAFQAERRLVQEDGPSSTTYARLTGGTGMGEALFGTGGDVTTGRRGLRFAFAETLALSWGRFDGGGYRDAATRGVEVRTAGLFAVAARRLAPGPLADALGRTDLRVGRTTVFAGTPDASTRTTFSLVIGR